MLFLNKHWGRGALGVCVTVGSWACESESVCGVGSCDEELTNPPDAGSEPSGGAAGGGEGSPPFRLGAGGQDAAPGQDATCVDGQQNGSELGVDCGGSCAPCADASCFDGVVNGEEPDVDCGGSCEALCAPGNTCRSDADCASTVCSNGVCVTPTCTDGVRNGDETAVDCGGGCPQACGNSMACVLGSDCLSGVCVDAVCQLAGCTDSLVNGDETDVDCGGSCSVRCASGQRCQTAVDCASAVCSESVCAPPSCADGVANGSETAVDCGGGCGANCVEGAACVSASDCQSASCVGDVCVAEPACTDSLLNGDETAVDCGGQCPACARGESCQVAADCRTDDCLGGVCVVGPSPGFQLSATSGVAPLVLSVTSSATAGDANIVSNVYRFEPSEAFAAGTTHTYTQPGNYTVTQRVTDANGLSGEQSAFVFVSSPATGGVFFNDSDTSPNVLIGEDGLSLDLVTFSNEGARTEASVAAGQGFFYFEGERLSEPYFFSFGLVTGSFNLAAAPGQDARSVGVETTQGVFFDSATVGGFDANRVDHYGFALDYRGNSPTVYVVAGDDLVATVTLDVSEPLYAYAGGLRSLVGPQLRINTGNDIQNFPFFYDVQSILAGQGVSTAGLVLGFGESSSRAPSTAPRLSVSGDSFVSQGGSAQLTAIASDDEDGNLAGNIRWSDLSEPYAERVVQTGGVAEFFLDTLGVHPIEVTVQDNSGLVTREVFDITVSGTLPQFNPVRLVPDARSGDGVVIAGDGLSAKFFNDGKYGVRANQGLLRGYQYFEIRRLGGVVNQGGGLVTAAGNLNPYDVVDVPPSCSVNYFASIWRNLISVASYDEAATDFYGFAVDYRGRTPVVHVITEDSGGAAEVATSLRLDDVTVPVYPLLYGNPTGNGLPNDATMNFAGPFHYSPAQVLANAGIDTADLQVGWGQANAN